MTKLRIGVQLYTLRKYLKKPADVPNVFKRVSELGAETVQVSGMCKINPQQLKEISEDYNLPICITHVPYNRLVNQLDEVIEEHKIFNCQNIGLGMMPFEYGRKDLNEIRRFCDFLNKTSEKLSKFDMTMNYHNHGFEFNQIKGKVIFDYIIENTDKSVKFIPDTFWIKYAGASPETYIQKLSGRINTVHLKDYKKSLGIGIMHSIGDGDLDFKNILNLCEDSRVENAVFELDYSPNAFRAVERSLGYLKKIYNKEDKK